MGETLPLIGKILLGGLCHSFGKKHLNYSKIEENFFTSFQLGGDEKHHYIVSVDSIVGPLMAVPNFHGDEHCYIMGMLYKNWNKDFNRFISRCDE